MATQAEIRKRQARIESLISETKGLIQALSSSQWAIGDNLVELTSILGDDGKPLNIKQISERGCFELGRTQLYNLFNTAKAFPPEAREQLPEGTSWYECHIATEAKRASIAKNAATDGEPIGDFLNDVLRLKKSNKRVKPKTVVKERIKRKMRKTQDDQASLAVRHSMANCHHRSCIDVMGETEKGSVKLLHLDPPYGQYRTLKNGKCVEPEAVGLANDCDNKTAADALKITLKAIREGAPLVSEDGFIILYQAASEPDRPDIIQALIGAGFKAIMPRYWKKGQPQPGSFESGLSYETERVLIAAKHWDHFKTNVAISGRSDVISKLSLEKYFEGDENERAEKRKDDPFLLSPEDECRPISRSFYHRVKKGEAHYGESHFFEKPFALNAYYLEKLTKPGDLVFDAFGCTGSMIEACIAMGRRWIYCESNETNYNLGLSRISRAIGQDPESQEGKVA